MTRKYLFLIWGTLIFGTMLFFIGCADTDKQEEIEEDYVYTVTRINQPVEINAEWDKEPWNSIATLHLNNHMGEDPDPRPEVHAKVAYDEEALYVIFHVQDQYVRCVVNEYQGPVWTDSCVEFFFTPGTDITKGYFNLETNCGGTALFAYQEERGVGRVNIPESDFEKIDLAHSMPSIVDPEITEPVTWTLEYRLPVEILTGYSDVTKPDSGVQWRANFYKIASDTSHPHYLTWSFVDNPTPQFHLPEFFGTIIFE